MDTEVKMDGFRLEDVIGAEELAALSATFGLKPIDLKRAQKFVEETESGNPRYTISFVALGDPPVAKRPRASRRKNKAGETVGIRMYAPDGEKRRGLTEIIRSQVPEGFVPFAGEVELDIVVYRPFLASWPPYKCMLAEAGYIRPEARPDYDNYAKIVTDAMLNLVYVDDGQVVFGGVHLRYAQVPRLEVQVVGRYKRLT